jgi:hypothetical protein
VNTLIATIGKKIQICYHHNMNTLIATIGKKYKDEAYTITQFQPGGWV